MRLLFQSGLVAFGMIAASPFACFAQGLAGAKIDTSDIAVKSVQAFPELQWAGWSPEDDRGRQQELRPIVVTHAGDGSGRIFVATQRGVIHTIRKRNGPQKTKIFLDMQSSVRYADNENEEGFLGLAFHPNHRQNGEFYVYYTTTEEPHTSIVARRRVDKDHPSVADPNFEEQLLRIKQPFWNHNGGAVAFGPDGYLYVALGDGGAANDPHKNGQDTSTLFASILRLDVDRKADGKAYAIPSDNPFVGKDGHREEIYAYGLRNVWGMSFDSQTGDFWAADVGQNKWEEVNLIESGGNYGWNIREAFHAFPGGNAPAPEGMIEPVFEYDHKVGKSITGGFVYRGNTVPGLVGHYVYADYVSGKIWALKYDASQSRAVANRLIESPKSPVISFGVDEDQELYFTMPTKTGAGLFRFEAK